MAWWQADPSARAHGDIPEVLDLTHDSRLLRPGAAFVAIPGARDGHDFIEQALANGAAALVVQADREQKWSRWRRQAPIVSVDDTRAAAAPMAAAVHGNPSAKLRLTGVTGTDGKTTTSHLAAHVLDACGMGCGYLSSSGFDTGGGYELNASHMTTVEGTTLQALLAGAVAAGRRSMLVEASSEGLAQHRLDGCQFDVAVFTNLTRDHLDFHGTMERYLAAKGLLFEKLNEPSAKSFPRSAVLNADDPASAYLRDRCDVPVLTYGFGLECDFRAESVTAEGFGLRFDLLAGGRRTAASLPLIGRFNVLNSLAAVAVAQSQGADLDAAVAALATFPGVPGRLERIDSGQPFSVYVDIASTPAALENVLLALRPATPGRLWAVFGAAGGRDPARREGMGEVAGRLADRAILTSEDPRDEEPDLIIEAIARGLRSTGRSEGNDFIRLPDRRAALARAIAEAAAGDTVLLAGKATETTMIVRGRHLPWDERAITKELLATHGYRG
jgi:UDP-N-acetylmuramoyl-L-alanyl-D-glutamate--2,6-diaminopimelate ligase